MNLLEVKKLSVSFSPAGGPVVDAVHGISFGWRKWFKNILMLQNP